MSDMDLHTPNLWQRFSLTPHFGPYWISLSFSSFGWALTHFVVPVMAAVFADATPVQMGWLVVCIELPVVLFSLPVGVLLDRREQRAVLGWTLLADLALLTSLAVFYWQTSPTIVALFASALALGTTKVIADLGYTSYLPKILDRARLVPANARLKLSSTAVQMAAPVAGGFLVTLVSAPAVLVLAAVQYAIAFAALHGLPLRPVDASVARSGVMHEAVAGIRMLFEHVLLRPVVLSACLGSFAFGFYNALSVLALTRNLGLAVDTLGLLVALGGIGALVGSLLTPAITARAGIGRTLIVGNLLSTLGYGTVAWSVSAGIKWSTVAGLLLIGLGVPLYSISQISIRQAVTPLDFMGRVNAARRFVVFGFLPVGGLAGGIVAEASSVGTALYCGALFMLLATLVPCFSPLRRREIEIPT